MTPAAAPSRTVAKETSGVGHTAENICTGIDDDMNTFAVSSANLAMKEYLS